MVDTIVNGGSADDLGWVHAVQPPARGPARGVLVLLHGTGGDETSLVALGQAVAPDHLLVGVRGRSDEEGVTRFFRRFDALHYDQDHLASEARALAAFAREASSRYASPDLPRAALGYSNGANVALAAQLLDPATFTALALLRAVQPFDRPPTPQLGDLEVLLLLGRSDPYLAAGQGLPAFLGGQGAHVEDGVLDAGHGLTREDVARLAAWFAALSA
ncbi:MAG: alpha/beta hydrolase [Deinococcales bacterium]